MIPLLFNPLLLLLLVVVPLVRAEQDCQPDWQTVTLQARRGRSSFLTWQPDCYAFDVTTFHTSNNKKDDNDGSNTSLTETTITKQVAYGEGFPAGNEEEDEEEESVLNTILDFYDMIEAYCLEHCPEYQIATECRITYDTFWYANPDTPGALFDYYIPATIEMDMPADNNNNGNGDDNSMIKYNLTHFTGLDCAALQEEQQQQQEEEQNTGIEVNPMFGEVCHEWQDVLSAYEPALSSWEQYGPDCYQFTWQWFGQMQVEPVVSQVVNGQVVSGQDFMGRSMTITDFYDLINDKCLKDCPDDGAYLCNVQYDTFYTYNAVADIVSMQIPKFIAVDDIQMAIDDEFSYQISDFSAIHCDSPGIDVGDASTTFRDGDP